MLNMYLNSHYDLDVLSKFLSTTHRMNSHLNGNLDEWSDGQID